MRRILIPTDFSDIAENALKYAIEIAAKFDGELLLYHVYSMNKKLDYDWDFPEDEQPYVMDLERKMNNLKGKYKEEFKRKGISIETKVEEHHIFTLFDTLVRKHEIDLIIMGSQGATGLEKVVFGSVAAQASDLAKVPVIVVPPLYEYQAIDKIVWATDLNSVSANTLAPMQELAVRFNAHLTILNINTGESKKKSSHQIESYLQNVETTYQEAPLSESINQSINLFIKAMKCDLLCMIRREKGFFESLFQTSITKEQVYNTQTPFLVLPEA